MNDEVDYKGKNGLARDIAKLRSEFTYIYRPAMRGPWAEFKDASLKDKVHKITNLHVESARAAPYLWGHVTMMSMVLNIIAWGALAVYVVGTHG